MPIVIGILAAVIIYMEIDRRQMRERLLFQAKIPKDLGPVRTTAPVVTARDLMERADERRRIATVKIPS